MEGAGAPGRRSVQAAHSGMQSNQPEQGIYVRCPHADCTPDFVDDRDQRIDFERASGFGVLQHGRLECTQLPCNLEAFDTGLADGTADPRAQVSRFLHGGQAAGRAL